MGKANHTKKYIMPRGLDKLYKHGIIIFKETKWIRIKVLTTAGIGDVYIPCLVREGLSITGYPEKVNWIGKGRVKVLKILELPDGAFIFYNPKYVKEEG